MSCTNVGALKRFLEQFPDDYIVYGYEEVGGIRLDDSGPSAIVVVAPNKDTIAFHTGDYAWSGNPEPKISNEPPAKVGWP